MLGEFVVILRGVTLRKNRYFGYEDLQTTNGYHADGKVPLAFALVDSTKVAPPWSKKSTLECFK